MSEAYQAIIKIISDNSVKPALFTPGETRFWDDPHISKSMLESHLDPVNPSASRRSEVIDAEINHLLSAGIVKPGDKLLDIGCGPGLYAGRLAARGVKVTGIDISGRSLNYAIAQARNDALDVEYRPLNFFNLDYENEFDAVMQVYGELNTFSPERLDALLKLVRRALRDKGRLVFDITTRELRKRAGLKNRWYTSGPCFWRPEAHLVMEEGFDYPGQSTWLDRYIVMDKSGIKVYHIWFRDYTLDEIRPVLRGAGFEIIHAWNDLAGTPYQPGGDWLGIVAEKR
jgi:SAM-dependent methyltransferase